MSFGSFNQYPFPKYATRGEKEAAVLVLFLTAIYLGLLFGYAGSNLNRFFVATVVFVAVAMIVAGRSMLRTRRICLRLRESDYRLCAHCGFDLRTLPDEYKCPECGNDYNLDVLKKQWKEWKSLKATFWD